MPKSIEGSSDGPGFFDKIRKQTRKNALTDSAPKLPPLERVVDLYVNQQLPGTKIADRYETTRQAVYNRLRRAEVPTRPHNPRPNGFTDTELSQIVYKYTQDKIGLESLAGDFGTNRDAIKGVLEEKGVELRPVGRIPRIPVSKEQLEDLYHKKGLTQEQIGAKFGKGQNQILRWFKTYGIKSRKGGFSKK